MMQIIAGAIGALVVFGFLFYRYIKSFKLAKPYTISMKREIVKASLTLTYPKYQLPDTIMVVGGAGFLGKNIVSALLKQAGATRPNVHVIVFDKAPYTSDSSAANSNVTAIQGDMLNTAEVTKVMRDHNVQAVIHVASPAPDCPNASLLRKVNVEGTKSVVDATKAAGVPIFVYTSSASVVWAGQGQEGVTESVSYASHHRDPYAESKALAEEFVMAEGKKHSASSPLITISLRPHGIFGPHDPQLVPTLAAIAREGRNTTILGDGRNQVDFTFVNNVVHAHLLAVQTAFRAVSARTLCPISGKTYFITNDSPVLFWDFMNWIWMGLGYDTATNYLPYGLAVILARIATFFNSIANIVRSKPTSIRFSVPRVQLAALPHWYKCDAAKRDLGYAPIWDMMTGLYMTLMSFPKLRNNDMTGTALIAARRGGLFDVGLLAPPTSKKGGAHAQVESAPTKDSTGKVLRRGITAFAKDLSDLPEIPLSEIAKHNNKKDVWVIIDDLVYDVTPYVEQHPGGEEEISQHAGGFTQVFKQSQHPDHVYETVLKFMIGHAPGWNGAKPFGRQD